jgi:hypothetical protein
MVPDKPDTGNVPLTWGAYLEIIYNPIIYNPSPRPSAQIMCVFELISPVKDKPTS